MFCRQQLLTSQGSEFALWPAIGHDVAPRVQLIVPGGGQRRGHRQERLHNTERRERGDHGSIDVHSVPRSWTDLDEPR